MEVKLPADLTLNSMHLTRGLYFHKKFGKKFELDEEQKGADERVVKVNEIRRLKQWPLSEWHSPCVKRLTQLS